MQARAIPAGRGQPSKDCSPFEYFCCFLRTSEPLPFGTRRLWCDGSPVALIPRQMR
jgi:hypothetical protein